MERINCVFDDKDFGFVKGNTKFQSDEIFQDYKPIRDANKRFNTLAEENAKRAVQAIDSKKEAHAQRIGKLYMTGSDSAIVKHDIASRKKRALKKKKSSKGYTMASSFPLSPGQGGETDEDEEEVVDSAARLLSPTQSLLHATKPKHTFPSGVQSSVDYNPYSKHNWDKPYNSQCHGRNIPLMRSSTALYHLDRTSEGKYNVCQTLSPYDERFRVSVLYVLQKFHKSIMKNMFMTAIRHDNLPCCCRNCSNLLCAGRAARGCLYDHDSVNVGHRSQEEVT